MFGFRSKPPVIVTESYKTAKDIAKRCKGKFIPCIGYPFVGSDAVSFEEKSMGTDVDGVPLVKQSYDKLNGSRKLDNPRTVRIGNYSPEFTEPDDFIEDARDKLVFIPANMQPFVGELNRRILNYVISPSQYGTVSAYEYRYDRPLDRASVEHRFAFIFDLYWPDPANSHGFEADTRAIQKWLASHNLFINNYTVANHSFIIIDPIDDDLIYECYDLYSDLVS